MIEDAIAGMKTAVRARAARVPSWAVVLSVSGVIGALAATISVLMLAQAYEPHTVNVDATEVTD